MVQNYIIVAAPAPPPCTSTGSLLSHITYYCPITDTPVSPLSRLTIVHPTYHFITTSLLPHTDIKEVTIPQTISPQSPYLRQLFHTFPLILTLGPDSS